MFLFIYTSTTISRPFLFLLYKDGVFQFKKASGMR